MNNKLIAKNAYEAFANGDRDYYEKYLSKNFVFSSPLDIGLDKNGYFEKCWPGAGKNQNFNFVRMIEFQNEVIVTYELTNSDGSISRNTEILTINDEKILRAEVYFGWKVN